MKKVVQICGMVVLSVSLFACSRDTSSTTPTDSVISQTAPADHVPLSVQGKPTSKYGRLDPEVPHFNRLKGQAIVPITKVYFNVVAHADDWELFFSPEVYREMTDDATKNVFIYTTAGDAGAGPGPVGNPYYKAREEGANAAVRFIANVTATDGVQPVVSTVSVAGHKLRKVAYRNTVSYFLRLPDGAPDGQGFNGQSLQLFFDKKIPTITAIDSTTSYSSWTDLTNTVKAVIKNETGSLGKASFNLMDSDPVVHVDHSDHIYTTILMNSLLKNMPCVSSQYFLTYWKNYTPEWPINMQSEDIINHAAVVGVMQAKEADVGYPGSWDEFHKSFIGKDYSRTVPATSTSPCI